MARARATDTAALVAAAAQVIHARGYHNATIDDIAEAAGISRPTVYKYARSKQHLIDMMIDTVTEDMSARTRAALDSTDDAGERLRRVVRTHVDSAVANRDFYAIVFSEQLEVSGGARSRFRSWARGVTTEFQELLDQCLEAQPTPPAIDTHVAANLVLSMLTGLHRWYDPAGRTPPAELTEQILRLLGTVRPGAGNG